MQVEKLPTWVHNELDKAIQSCVWGRTAEKKGIHLVKWENLIKPNEMGGINLKVAKEMNWAVLAKLAWRLLSCEGEVWTLGEK